MCRTFHLRGCYNYPPLYHLQYLFVCIISMCFFMPINAFPRDLYLKIQMAQESFRVLWEPSTHGSYSFVCPMTYNWMQSCWKYLTCEDSKNLFFNSPLFQCACIHQSHRPCVNAPKHTFVSKNYNFHFFRRNEKFFWKRNCIRSREEKKCQSSEIKFLKKLVLNR